MTYKGPLTDFLKGAYHSSIGSFETAIGSSNDLGHLLSIPNSKAGLAGMVCGMVLDVALAFGTAIGTTYEIGNLLVSNSPVFQESRVVSTNK